MVWNQGMRAMQAEWAIVVNDDPLVGASWLDIIRVATIRKGVVVFSPIQIEGKFLCGLEAFADEARQSGRSVARRLGRAERLPRGMSMRGRCGVLALAHQGVTHATLTASLVDRLSRAVLGARKASCGCCVQARTGR